MSAQRIEHLSDNPRIGNQFWVVAERDTAGRPIRLQRVHDVEVVHAEDGTIDHFRVGVHPSRADVFAMEDVVTTIDLDYYRSHPRVG